MLDFAAIKKQTTIEQVVTFLGLDLKQEGPALRGKCPVCDSSNHRALAVSKDRQAAYCFAAQKGGDMLWLISHVRGVGVRKAAEDLADHIGHMDNMVTVPQKPKAEPEVSTAAKEKETPPPAQGFKPLDYLDHDYEACKVFADAKSLGIGYAPKGILRGKLAIPLYKDGTLAGYVGISPDTELTIPKNLKTVVE